MTFDPGLSLAMNDDIVNKYGINFQNRLLNLGGLAGRIDKFPCTAISNLTLFLIEWDSAAKINDLLLPDIEYALANSNSEIENGSTVVDITIYHDVVDFYPHSGSIFCLPTNDFKEIVEGWRNFLLTPPLNDSRV